MTTATRTAARTLARTLAIGWLLAAAPTPAAAQTAFAGVFTTPLLDDAPDEKPWGARAGATLGNGVGLEGRWAHTGASDYWSAGLLQILPGPHSAKTLQPFGAIGVGRLTRSGEGAAFLSLAGGVATFIGHVGLGVDFRYVRGTERLAGEKIRERHVSFELLWRF